LWGDCFQAVTSAQVVQPLFNNTHQWDFTNFNFPNLHPGDKETSHVQLYFSTATPEINRLVGDNANSILFDGHKKVILFSFLH
jgi:hypothetical protein